MKRAFIVWVALAAGASGGSSVSLRGQEHKDHPLISRFQGAQVLDYKESAFDAFDLPAGQITGADTFTKVQPVEGKITQFKYSIPPERSTLEVMRSYQNALAAAGFQTLYACAGTECISKKFEYGYTSTRTGDWCATCRDPMRYVAAKLARPAGDVYVAVLVNTAEYHRATWLSILEPKPMAAGSVTVNAAALGNDITSSGHASVYGILFDTGKAVVKPESDATLAEIAKLLDARKDLKLHVVGHTDNVGTLTSNMTLSKQRADAVVDALVTRYHIVAARLQAAGVGPLAPVAPNKTEDGRARNRRVELVEQ